MRVEILMYDGVSEIDTLAPFKVFSLARRLGGDIEITLVTADGKHEVKATDGVRFADLRQWRPDRTDVLVVAGGWIEPIMNGQTVSSTSFERLRSARDDGSSLVASVPGRCCLARPAFSMADQQPRSTPTLRSCRNGPR